MSTVTKSKLYLLIITVLLLSNIVLLFMFFKKDGKRGFKNDKVAQVTMFLKNEIGFSDKQISKVEELRKANKEKMKDQFDAMKGGKQNMFKFLGANGFSDSAINESVQKTIETQKQMELQMLTHFASIRKICNANQLPKFDSLFYKLWERKKTDKSNK